MAARRSADDTNLDELREVRDAIADAIEALKTAMRGSHPSVREKYVFKLGFAYGRLRRIIERAHGGGP
jgi:chaperonin GroEL (HSP60 family)